MSEIELGMTGAILDQPNLTFKPCMDDQMVLVLPKGHRLGDADEVDFSEVLSDPFIIREKGSGSRLTAERALVSACFDRLNIVTEVGSTEAMRQAIKLAIISRHAVEDDIRAGLFHTARIKGVDLRRKFYLL
ncbi:MAG: LysR substrate-binding domain-containing protein [Dissulfurimicrobium sp.]|uniref:LysR substrate-binding domain-containing protein n=1 Tax=Dissulfurimicrobium sp. TaxID=2022436 RepID=UPI00404B2870